MKYHSLVLKSHFFLLLLLFISNHLYAQRRHIEYKPITDQAMISDDLKYASTNGTDGYGFIWDLETGRPIHTIGPSDGERAQIFINPEGTLKLVRSKGMINIYPIKDTVALHSYSDEGVWSILGIAKGSGHIVYMDAASTSGEHIISRMNLDGTDKKKLLECAGKTHYIGYQNTKYYSPYSFYRLVADNTYILYYEFGMNGKVVDYQIKKYAAKAVATGKNKTISYSDKEGFSLAKPYYYDGTYLIAQNSDETVRLCNSSGVAFFEKGSPYVGKIFTSNRNNLDADLSADGSMIAVVSYAEDLNNLTYDKQFMYYTTLSTEKKYWDFNDHMSDPDWKMAAAGPDGSKFAVLFRDYMQQGAAIAFYDAKTGKEENVLYLQSGPARTYYPTKSQLAEEAKKLKEQKEAAEAAKYVHHCMGYLIVDDPSPEYDITIYYTGIVSFKSERKQTDLKSGVTMFCGDKALLELEIDKLKATAAQKNGRLILDTSLISNSEVFRNP